MKNSEHSPEEQQPGHTSADNEPNVPDGNTTPAPDISSAASVDSPPTTKQESEHDAIRQGLAYPPPPSFYQQAQPEPAQPYNVQGIQDSAEAAPPPQPPPMGQWGAPPPGYPRFAQGQSYLEQQPPPYFPGPPPMQPQPKQANGWLTALWITLGLVIALSCGLCGWAGVTYMSAFSGVATSIGSSQNIINNYYDALQNQNYSQAYSYLQPQGSISGLTQDQFTQNAQQADAQHGKILRYTPGQLQSKFGNHGSIQFTDDVQIVREHKQYTAHLTLGMVNGKLQILSYDTL